MSKFKVGDRVRFNSKEPLYSNPAVKQEWKDIGLDRRKIYTVTKIVNTTLIDIDGLNYHDYEEGIHIDWWIKVPDKKTKVRKKYKKFIDKLQEIE